MPKYTTITVSRRVLNALNDLRRELNKKSLGDTIMELIKFYKSIKAKQFAEEVKEVRREGLNDVKKEILKLRKLRWAKS